MREQLHTLIFGKRLKDSGLTQHKLGVLWGMPMFSSDTISTVSYSAEEILLVLMPVLGTAAYGIFVPIVAALVCLLAISSSAIAKPWTLTHRAAVPMSLRWTALESGQV